MDIACPNCAATYRVPEALLAQGKPLRCAACGETWVPAMPPAVEEATPPEPQVQEASLPDVAPAEPGSVSPDGAPDLAPDVVPDPGPPGPEPAAAAVSPAAPPRPASPLSPPPLNPPVLQRRPGQAFWRRPGTALRLAWVASLATVALALAALLVFGDAIAAAWPPFARVTALLGG